MCAGFVESPPKEPFVRLDPIRASSVAAGRLRALTQRSLRHAILRDLHRQAVVVGQGRPSINRENAKRTFLGVIIDEHLTWKCHINLVKNKAAKMIGIIKRLKFTLPLSALRILYNAFVLPCLNYGLILWGERERERESLMWTGERGFKNLIFLWTSLMDDL